MRSSHLSCYVFFAFLRSVLVVRSYELQMKPGPISEENIAIIIKELLKALEYLHGEGKIHRDIKGLLLSHNSPVRLVHSF